VLKGMIIQGNKNSDNKNHLMIEDPTDSISWVKIYHSECDCPMVHLGNAYDRGIYLMGWFQPNYPHNSWLIKADINGNILWERVVSGGNSVAVVTRIAQSNDGCIYIQGNTMIMDMYGDPYLLKLDPCGQKIWCRIFHTPEHWDGSWTVTSLPDGGSALILSLAWGENFQDTNRICLTRLDQNGNELWRNYYSRLDSRMHNETDRTLYYTPDSGFLISGWCSYEDSISLSWLSKCYYIKSDQQGNREWETIAEKYYSLDKPGGMAESSIINHRNDYYYSSIARYLGPGVSAPAILKMDTSGYVAGIYELVSGYSQANLVESEFADTATMIGSAGWYSPDSMTYYSSKAVKFDTNGVLLKEKFLLSTEYLSWVRKTSDNKFLFFLMRDNSTNPNYSHYDTYLFKLTQDLESDSIYTIPITYDSLCPEIMPYDSITIDDCGVIVNLDSPMQDLDGGKMKVYPNPSSEKVHITLPKYSINRDKGSLFTTTHIDFQYLQNAVLEIYNITGEKIFTKSLYLSDKKIELNINQWLSGIYLIRLANKGYTIQTSKLIIYR